MKEISPIHTLLTQALSTVSFELDITPDEQPENMERVSFRAKKEIELFGMWLVLDVEGFALFRVKAYELDRELTIELHSISDVSSIVFHFESRWAKPETDIVTGVTTIVRGFNSLPMEDCEANLIETVLIDRIINDNIL